MLSLFFLGCPSADVSADGKGGPPGFAIPGTTSYTLGRGQSRPPLYPIRPTVHHAWFSMGRSRSDCVEIVVVLIDWSQCLRGVR